MKSGVFRNLIELALLFLFLGACSSPIPSLEPLESIGTLEATRPLFNAMPTQTPQILRTSTPIPVPTPRLLFREDIPREVLIDQISWRPGLGGGGSCGPSSESFWVWDEQATVGTVVYFCHYGLSPGEIIEITVTDPNGTGHRFNRQIDEDYGVSIIWPVWLDAPLGRYYVVARTTSGSVSTVFEVRLPASPVVLINPSSSMSKEFGMYGHQWKPGDILDVMYAGFEPDEVVEVVIFFSPCPWEAVERFATWQIQMDSKGQAFERLQVPGDWPEGPYEILTFGKQRTGCPDWWDRTSSESDTICGYPCSAYDLFSLGNLDPREVCFESSTSTYISVGASSILPPEQRHSYEPVKATDGMISTAWVEGVPGPGVGEWIELAFPHEREVWGIGLDIGFDENEYLFYANNRIRQVRLHFSDDPPTEVMTQDIRGMQYFRIPFVHTTFVRLEILNIYPGNRWNDTCLAEMEVQFR